MRRFSSIIYILFIIPFALFGQTKKEDCLIVEIQGQIIDKSTGQPIPFATIHTDSSHHSATSDVDGNYTIHVCEGETISVSCLGYENCKHEQHGHQDHEHTVIALESSTLLLDEVVISVKHEEKTGVKTLATKTIAKEDIQQVGANSLGEALTQISGVNTVSNGANVQVPIIHGLYGNRISVLNNGFKHGFQNWGSGHAPEIDVHALENIKVIKGAAAVRYGAESMGGIVEVESHLLKLHQPLSTTIGLGVQTNGRAGQSNFSIQEGKENLAWAVKGNWSRSGDRKTPDYYLSNSGKAEWGFNGGLRFHKNKFDTKIGYGYINQNLGLYRTAIADSGNTLARAINSSEPLYTAPFSYKIKEPNQLLQHHLATGELSYWINEDSRLVVKAAQQINHRKEFDVRRNAHKPIIDLTLATSDVQLTWKHPSWKNIKGDIGVQFFYQDNNNNPGTGTTAFIPNYNTTRWSGYLIEVLRKDKQLFELGARLDFEQNDVRGRVTNQEVFRDNYDLQNVSVSLGYGIELSDILSFKTNIASAWRTPNVAELYSFGHMGFKTHFGLLRYYNNGERVVTDEVLRFNATAIQPEKSWKWVGEMDFQSRITRFNCTAYINWISNFVYQRPYGVLGTIRGPSPYFVYQQTDAVFLGIDVSYSQKMLRGLWLDGGASYLYSKGTKRSTSLINQPPANVNIKLAWDLPLKKNWGNHRVFLANKYVFEQYNAPSVISVDAIMDGGIEIVEDTPIFDFKAAPKGYFLMDLGWNFKLGSLSGSIICKNVLDQSYRSYLNEMRYFADEIGRNILFKINYNF